MYQIFSNLWSKELEIYWKSDHHFTKDQLYVDSEALQSIVIYTLVQTQSPKLLIDVLMVEKFTPKSLQYTNRAFYMTALHAAFERIEEMSQEELVDIQLQISDTKKEHDGLFIYLGMIEAPEGQGDLSSYYQNTKKNISEVSNSQNIEETKTESSMKKRHRLETMVSWDLSNKDENDNVDLEFYQSGIKQDFTDVSRKAKFTMEYIEEESPDKKGLIAIDPYFSSFKDMPRRFSVLM